MHGYYYYYFFHNCQLRCYINKYINKTRKELNWVKIIVILVTVFFLLSILPFQGWIFMSSFSNVNTDLLLTYILTYSMVQSPSWEANWFAASQEFTVFHGTRRFITALTSVRHLSLSWANPIPSIYPTSHLLEIHPNFIHPFTPRSPQWSPSLRFPH